MGAASAGLLAVGGAAGSFTTALISSNGDLKAAAQGALTGGAFGFVGGSFLSGSFESYVAHAAVGCASGAANGGGSAGCARGAASQVLSKWVTVETQQGWTKPAQFAAATVAGGTASMITGGKFGNGPR
jgi:hypothetical protein